MHKFLKIGGIVFAGMAVIIVTIFYFSVTFLGGNAGLSSGDSSLSGSGAGRGFATPMSTGLPSGNFSNSLGSQKIMQTEIAPMDMNQPGSVENDKKIIKNGDLNLKVDSADVAATKIADIAQANSGEVFSSNFYQNSNNVKSGTISLKVPLANFEKTFSEVKKVASLVLRESTSGQDVTEQYTDLQAQLKNSQAEEQSFTRILDQAQKIDDVLAVTRELARVRGEIEQLQGQIKYLASQTDMSTITVSLSEDQNITISSSWRPWQVVKDSANSLLKGLQGFVNFVIRFLIVMLPLLLIWAIIFWAIYRLGKKIYFKIRSRE